MAKDGSEFLPGGLPNVTFVEDGPSDVIGWSNAVEILVSDSVSLWDVRLYAHPVASWAAAAVSAAEHFWLVVALTVDAVVKSSGRDYALRCYCSGAVVSGWVGVNSAKQGPVGDGLSMGWSMNDWPFASTPCC